MGTEASKTMNQNGFFLPLHYLCQVFCQSKEKLTNTSSESSVPGQPRKELYRFYFSAISHLHCDMNMSLCNSGVLATDALALTIEYKTLLPVRDFLSSSAEVAISKQ
jgi:hypothetical protein